MQKMNVKERVEKLKIGSIKKECEEIWAKNKYYVLSKSHKIYLEIREYLKENEVDVLYLQDKIQKARDMEESTKDFSNAILHVWGYFKKEASENEKQGLFDMLEEYMDGKKSQTSVIDYINALLEKYPNKYLQESTLLVVKWDMKKRSQKIGFIEPWKLQIRWFRPWGIVSFVVLMKVWSLTLNNKREVNALFRLILSKIQGFEDVFNNKEQIVFDTTLDTTGGRGRIIRRYCITTIFM